MRHLALHTEENPMTAQELIRALASLDPDTPVYLTYHLRDYCETIEVHPVELVELADCYTGEATPRLLKPFDNDNGSVVKMLVIK
jgi:hypothetical protein